MDPVTQPPGNAAEWHYVGHYGQLGPLTMPQMEELIVDGVVDRETYVWQTGMPDWLRAGEVPRLVAILQRSQPLSPAPTPPVFQPRPTSTPPRLESPITAPIPPSDPFFGQGANRPNESLSPYGGLPTTWGTPGLVSDKSRLVAGLLQLLIPGVGRMYLGYAAQGVMQLVLTPFGCLVGWIWSIIDGIVILSGGVQHDGYGRRLGP